MKYKFTTVEESVTDKDWAAGSSKPAEIHDFVRLTDGSVNHRLTVYAPSWLKTIDEAVVNALDHYVRCLSGPAATAPDSGATVTTIQVSFGPAGEITVRNDGPGIDVAIHTVATELLGVETWVPTLIFGRMFQGSNLRPASDSIIGGTNGIGAKICVIFSKNFTLRTVDAERRLQFVQRWAGKLEAPHPPVITKSAARPFTELSYELDYAAKFGEVASAAGQFASPARREELESVARWRTTTAAVYVGYVARIFKTRAARVSFNGGALSALSLEQLAAAMFPSAKIFKCMAAPAGVKAPVPVPGASLREASAPAIYRYPWEVVVCVSPDLPVSQWSIVNGIIVKNGNHLDRIRAAIVEGAKVDIARALGDKQAFHTALITSNICVLVCAAIPSPNWSAQIKDALSIPPAAANSYKLPARFIAQVAAELKDRVLEVLLAKAPRKSPSARVTYDKLRPAAAAGPKYASKCRLFVAEGDSAMLQTIIGITSNPNLGLRFSGCISTGGVILNVRKLVKTITTASGATYRRPNSVVKENKFLNALMAELGLSYDATYDPETAKGRAELKALRYSCVIGCVDQDLDGVGNIFGLILNLFEFFWPNLLLAGFVKRFDTPIIRSYPKKGGQVLKFYSEHEYRAAVLAFPGGESGFSSAHDTRYFKGLASHSREEDIAMFGVFEEHLVTYTYAPGMRQKFTNYYGPDSEPRKRSLAVPRADPDEATLTEWAKSLSIPCDAHFDDKTDAYSRDNLLRKLPNLMDGFNESGRKIFDGASKCFAGKKAKATMKVSELAGYISLKEHYHHGEASLSSSIIGRAFLAVGGVQLPFILPLSGFGSRLGGGADAGAPRYLFARFNNRMCDVLYPRDDYWSLPFDLIEGARCEPRYFAPIVPTVLLESMHMPGTGWKVQIWGRAVSSVIAAVRRLIELGETCPLPQLEPDTHGWTGEIRDVRGKPWAFGRYELTHEAVTITELPLRSWTKSYFLSLQARIQADGGRIVKSLRDASSDEKVSIRAELAPGAFEILTSDELSDSIYADGVEAYFQLSEPMSTHLNLIGTALEVISLRDYKGVFPVWFKERRARYGIRVARLLAILDAKILKQSNVIRYIEVFNTLGLGRLARAEMEARLAKDGFDRLNGALVENPGFCAPEEIPRIVKTGANYSYLLNTTDYKKSAEALVKQREKLAALKKQRSDLVARSQVGKFTGAAMWLDDLAELEQVIAEGRRTNWKYEEYGKYKN